MDSLPLGETYITHKPSITRPFFQSSNLNKSRELTYGANLWSINLIDIEPDLSGCENLKGTVVNI